MGVCLACWLAVQSCRVRWLLALASEPRRRRSQCAAPHPPCSPFPHPFIVCFSAAGCWPAIKAVSALLRAQAAAVPVRGPFPPPSVHAAQLRGTGECEEVAGEAVAAYSAAVGRGGSTGAGLGGAGGDLEVRRGMGAERL